jgi:Tfp pilus assembly protein PilF
MNKTSFYSFLLIVAMVVCIAACDSNKPVVPESGNNNMNQVKEGFPSDSFAYYENILVKDSMNVDLRLALATNYYSERLFEKAIDHLLKVVRIDNKNLEALITLGNVYYDAGQNENAVIWYEKALVLDPKNVNVRCDLATCYLNMKQPEKSMTLLKKNLEMDPKHAQSHHNLSVVYSQLGKTKEAEEEMKVFNSLGK